MCQNLRRLTKMSNPNRTIVSFLEYTKSFANITLAIQSKMPLEFTHVATASYLESDAGSRLKYEDFSILRGHEWFFT